MSPDNLEPMNKSIGLLVFPLQNPDRECGQDSISSFASILLAVVKRVFVISGNVIMDMPPEVSIVNVKTPVVKSGKEPILSGIHRFLLAQLTLSVKLVHLAKKLDTIILFISNGLLPLPVFMARILGKEIIVIVAGSGSQSTRAEYSAPLGWIFSLIIRLTEHFDYLLADKIVVYSKNMVKSMGVEKYKRKVVVEYGNDFYIDLERFDIKKGYRERGNIVGYVGRLSGEKGVIELAKAIPLILARKGDIRFSIVGDGPLMVDIKKELEKNGCLEKVHFAGWVPRDKVPDYLNEMKFHVLPSHTEALGGTNLEAMACGAISIVNSVGGMLDIVTDGETGFLLKDNQPQTIADKVAKVWNHPRLEEIQKRARAFVEQNYTFERAVERNRRTLSKNG